VRALVRLVLPEIADEVLALGEEERAKLTNPNIPGAVCTIDFEDAEIGKRVRWQDADWVVDWVFEVYGAS